MSLGGPRDGAADNLQGIFAVPHNASNVSGYRTWSVLVLLVVVIVKLNL